MNNFPHPIAMTADRISNVIRFERAVMKIKRDRLLTEHADLLATARAALAEARNAK